MSEIVDDDKKLVKRVKQYKSKKQKKRLNRYKRTVRLADNYREWKDMPEYEANNLAPYKTLYVHFRNPQDFQLFKRVIQQPLFVTTKSIWFPEKKRAVLKNLAYTDEE